MSQRMRWIVAAGLALVLALGGVGYAIWGNRPQPVAAEPPPGPAPAPAAPVLDLQPAVSSAAGVDPGSHFVLESAEKLDAKTVEKSLTIRPETQFQVEQANPSGTKYFIRPVRPLASNQVYQFTMQMPTAQTRPFQWAFQTRAAFRVRGSLPRDRSNGVPTNSGIEIYLSHDGYGDPAPFFSIEPAAPGRFERHKKALAFVPTQPLAPGTVYTVTLRKGLPLTGTDETLAEDLVFSFETSPDQPERPGQGYFYMHGDLAEFPVADTPYFTLSADKLQPVGVKVYRFPDAAAYAAAIRRLEEIPMWASYSRSRYSDDTAGLTEVAAFAAEMRQDPGQWYAYLLFPEPMPGGYYLATFTAGENTRQVRFQVTDLAAYVAASETDTLVWVRDLGTGEAAAGALIRPLSGSGGPWQVDGAGLAAFATPEPYLTGDPKPLFLQATSGTKESLLYVPPGWWYTRSTADTSLDYWRYLYLDRPLYKPSDTVHFWGIIRPRERGAAAITEVTAEIVQSYWTEYDSGELVLASTTVPVQNGSLTGKLELPNLRPNWYYLRVRSGDTVMNTMGFNVQTYTKPAYRIDLSVDDQAIILGDKTTFRLHASFFEGTPVQSLGLRYNLDGRAGQVVTGADGRATVEFRPTRASDPRSIWDHRAIFLNSSLPEGGEIHASAGVRVFQSHLYLQIGHSRVEDGTAIVPLQVNAVDLSRLNALGGSGWGDFIGPAAGGVPITGTLWEENWEKRAAGEVYDFINKVVIPQYHYDYKPINLGPVSAATGADGKAVYQFPVEPRKQYRLELEIKDGSGNPYQAVTYIYGSEYTGRDGEYQYYHLSFAERERWQYPVGEPIELMFKVNDARVPDRPGSFLFFTARRGLQQYRVQDSGLYRMALREQDLPQITVYGVYFDGRQFRAESQQSVRFDPSGRALQIAVTPDKPVYRPGETVQLHVQVHGPTGNPAPATVNLNLVDEALFALAGQHVDLLGRLYGDWIPSGIIRTRRSHVVPETSGGAEQGEGDGERSDFRDAIFFETVTTDANGRAEVQFQVPDNLTSWRVTYQGITDQLAAGSGNIRIPVKLPFFLEMVLNDVYLAGDQPIITVRTYGEQLKAGQQVELTTEITDPAGQRSETRLTAPAFGVSEIPLPRLTAGEYSVRVSAKAPGGMTDILRRSFRAEESFLRKTQTDHYVLSDATRITGAADGLTELSFTDRRRGTYLSLLRRLQWQGGKRLEFGLARRVASELGRQYFQDPAAADDPFDPLRYQVDNGGMAILPYADADLAVSAQVAAACPECVDSAALARYFYQVMEEPEPGRQRLATALQGLAALGEPVLLQVQELLRQPDMSLAEMLDAALAAARLGDLEPARAAYRRIIKDHGEAVGSAWRLRVEGDRDETIVMTARAAVLAARLGEPEDAGLLEYLLDNEPKETLVLLEELEALAAGLPRLPQAPVAFTYVLDGREQRREIKAGEVFRLALRPEQLAALQFRDIQGEVAAVSSYDGPFTVPAAGEQKDATLSRTYLLGGQATGTFAPGDLIKVQFKYSLGELAPGGTYEIVDFLPAGLKAVTNPWQMGMHDRNMGYPVEIHGQRVTFLPWKSTGELVYYARVVSTGEYTAENAVLQHARSGEIVAATGRATVMGK